MGIFDNATSVVIGNKEVQSIVRVSDGAVLYQKAASHSYALVFSSATYQTDSSGDVTVSVTLTDNGSPVSGQTVSFSDGSSVYTGITNSNGIASVTVNCKLDSTLTATFDTETTNCSITSNYVPTGLALIIRNTDSFASHSPLGNVPLSIDWGDGTTSTCSANSNFSHSYSSVGNYLIEITGNITSVGTYCFQDCTGLTEVFIPSSITSLNDGCFRGCTGLTSLTLPSSVTSIGSTCFYDCTGLTSLTLPSSVTSIGNSCFRGCTGLTSLTIPNNVTSLGNYCFYNCTGLTSLTIPNNVTSLGTSCFYNCTGLTSLTIPNNVTSLGTSCFYNCTGLTSLEIGSGVTTIGKEWIRDCKKLESLKFKRTNPATITSGSRNYNNVPTTCIIYVPTGSLSDYTSAANYPSSSTYTYVEY